MSELRASDGVVATCWTSAGPAAPLADERSPFSILDRVRAAGAAGFAGVGFGQDDLRAARETVGFAAVRSAIEETRLRHVEVELISDWWLGDDAWRPTWELLLEAASALGASFVKAGSGMGDAVTDVAPLVEPLGRLAEEAVAAGTRVALEPFPFGRVATIPQGAALVRAVAHPAAGLVVDCWHVFRSRTPLGELRTALEGANVLAVELSDADAEVHGTLFEDTRDRRRLLGDGAQDVAGFIRTMRHVGFDGPWGIEILSTEHRALPLDRALAVAHDSAAAALARV